MSSPSDPTRRHSLKVIFGLRRVIFTLCVSGILGLLQSLTSLTATSIVIGRAMLVGLLAMAIFGLLERWPARLPEWLGRWVLQLIGVVVSVPFSAYLAYWLTTGGDPQLGTDRLRLAGYGGLTFMGVLIAPWVALGAMVRQREAFARSQALTFELERSELERKALDARLRLLQAQVEPHFLFNTLANVQALVNAGSPQASRVLESLIAYLRAAVPRLHEPTTTLGQELQLVRAYLELMHMRMPDRLQFTLQVDAEAAGLQCPPMTLLTLVENAVKHGIDPGEEGGRIDVTARARNGRCFVRVVDTGVGLQTDRNGPGSTTGNRVAGGVAHGTGHRTGTGLSTLRERLQLAFGGDAQLQLSEVQPHGVCAELEFPARNTMP